MMKSILFIINSVLAYGVYLGHFHIGKVGVELPSNPAKSDKIITLSDREEACLVEYLHNHMTANGLGIMISLFTGIRLGEVCALQQKNIDLDHATIYISSTVQRLKVSEESSKTKLMVTKPNNKNFYREIPIPTFLVRYIEAYQLDKTNAEHYVLTESDLPYEPRTIQYGFKKILEKCGLEQKHYNCLRHTFAVNCLKNDVDAKALSEILGHKSVSFTLNRYWTTDMEQKRIQIEKLTSHYSNMSKENIKG